MGKSRRKAIALNLAKAKLECQEGETGGRRQQEQSRRAKGSREGQRRRGRGETTRWSRKTKGRSTPIYKPMQKLVPEIGSIQFQIISYLIFMDSIIQKSVPYLFFLRNNRIKSIILSNKIIKNYKLIFQIIMYVRCHFSNI